MRGIRRAKVMCSGAVLAFASAMLPAAAQVPELPVAHDPLARGVAIRDALPPVTPSAKTVDGATNDWIGSAASFGGALRYSAGELIYTDHLFDAYGADDGGDAERQSQYGTLWEQVPATSRTEHVLSQANGELGLPVDQLDGSEQYGDAGFVEQADLLRVRIAADDTNLYLMARTTTMTPAKPTAVLALIDRAGDGPSRPVPFGAGITTTAETALLFADGVGRAVDLATGDETSFAAAADPSGYHNTLEAAVPLSLVGEGASTIAVATGAFDPSSNGLKDLPDVGPNVANIAFRTDEPVRTWMDRSQALALQAGSMDAFAVPIDLARLRGGTTESWKPGAGYHERIFASSEAISSERELDGIHQHYGVYVPNGYDPGEQVPTTFWLHWRGGKAHSAATLAPRIFRDMGESRSGLVIAPRGRGSSTWYLGEGQVDFREVWDDSMSTFSVDRDRVYVSGHSMGGWGSYLLPILYPDRFAAAFPVAGPVTQGAWTGLDFEGCDDMRYEEYTPCFVGANDSDPRAQHTRPLLENLRTVPLAIFQGAADELVPVSGVTRQVERLVQLGYTHQYFVFPNYEHYSHPVVDEWMAGVRYIERFTRDPAPPRVTYVRDMVFERTVERGPSQFESPESGIDFSFDRAFWMSELEPIDDAAGTARFDGRSLAIAEAPSVMAPDASGPASLGQAGPYVGIGLMPLVTGAAPAPQNAFDVTLSGAKHVRLSLVGMRIDPAMPITGAVDTTTALTLDLAGGWTTAPTVKVNGAAVATTLTDGVLRVVVPTGENVAVSVG